MENKPAKNTKITKKLHELFIGKRTLKERFFTAFCSSLALSFILFLFGPLDLSCSAAIYVDYTVIDILPFCLAVWGVIFVILFLSSWIPGGKLHALLCSAFTGTALAFYIQGNWLNTDLGALDGQPVVWQNYSDNALLNFAVFMIIVLIPFLIHYFSRKVWKGAVIFISALLVAMQVVPLSMKVYNEWEKIPRDTGHFIMAKDHEYEIGKENIVVFILDTFGPEEMGKLLERYPNVLDPFHDFQYFTNFRSNYIGTFPAAAFLLTRFPYDWNIPPEEWLKQAWNSDDSVNFYSQMEKSGWTVRLFNKSRYVEGNLENAWGKISNIEKIDGPQEFSVNPSAFKKLIKLSFYRYFPLIMKAPFWIYTDELNGMKRLTENERLWDPVDSLQKYLDQGLTVNDETKNYTIYHFMGAHYPFEIKENGRRITHEQPGEIGLEGQLAGYLYGISQYIQQMKDYHVYDDSTVIITSDHGNTFNTNSVFMIKPKNQRQAEMTYSHAPVSQTEYMETIAEAAGLEKGQFGSSVFDFSEDDERERCTYIRWEDPSYPKNPGKKSNAIREFCCAGDNDYLYEKIINNEYNKSYHVPDPFY